MPPNFYELRKEGENDNLICELIRNDSINEFVVYVTKNSYPLQSLIAQSIYETNSFLIKKQIESDGYEHRYDDKNVSLIHYAAFFGSLQILKYLQMNNVDLTPELLIFAIHGKNPEMIHYLEEKLNDLIIENESNDNFDQNSEQNEYIKYLDTSIRCHHNDFVNYFLDKYFQLEDRKSYCIFKQCLKCYNFSFIQDELINADSFLYLCQYDYCSFVNILLKYYNIDITNFDKIQNYIF